MGGEPGKYLSILNALHTTSAVKGVSDMLLGVSLAIIAAVGYGLSSVMQALGARQTARANAGANSAKGSSIAAPPTERLIAPRSTAMHTAASAVLLQGSSLWCGVIVSAPSSLNRPHGPHSTNKTISTHSAYMPLSCYCGSLL